MHSGDTMDTTCSQLQKTSRLENLTLTLDGWREVLVKLYDFFVWKKQYYAYIIIAAVTFTFILFWYIEPSVLTTIAVLGMLLSLLDYVVPEFGPKLLRHGDKTADDEQQFKAICQKILDIEDQVVNLWNKSRAIKAHHPVKYCCTVCFGLLVIGYCGYYINNVLLMYLTALVCSLMPGLLYHGIAQKYFGEMCMKLKELLSKKTSKAKVQ